MKVLQRRAVLAAGLLSLAAGLPSAVLAQRGADVPRILVATFRSTDLTTGVEAGDAVRKRVTEEVPARTLWVISKHDIENTLKASGYRPDSALGASDLKELAKLLRADEILDGVAAKTASGVHIEPRLMLSRDVSLAQPLPAVDARNAGDAAKQIERELTQARKQLDDNRKCENDLRAGKNAEAVADAERGIKAYPQATLARLCLMSAYAAMKLPPDSILRVTNEILQIDPKSTLALRNQVQAYTDKGDTAKAIQASIALYRADPSNQSLIQSIVNQIARMGKPDVALPLIDDLLKDNPGDPQLLSTKWKLLLAASAAAQDSLAKLSAALDSVGKAGGDTAAIRSLITAERVKVRWKDALAAGEEYVKADTSAATADYFTRQIAAAAQDSQPQVAAQIAARAVQKFPKDASMGMLYAQTLRKAGQTQQALDAAKRAVAVDPKVQNGYLFVIVTEAELNQGDSALASARQAAAAGVDKNTIAQALIAPMGAVMKAAQATPSRAAWENAYRYASAVDSIAPSSNSKYFVGVSAFQAGLDALQNINKTKSCADANYADSMWSAAQIAMPAGAQVDKNTAGTILGAIQQYSPAIEQAKKAFCKKKGQR